MKLKTAIKDGYKKCYRCNGIGLIAQDMMHGGKCFKCKGKGYYKKVSISTPLSKMEVILKYWKYWNWVDA